jgi:hypothetical protein
VKTYICKKPCILNGAQLSAGEEIPHDLLVESRIPKLLSMGVIEEAPARQPRVAQDKREDAEPTNDTLKVESPVKPPQKPAKRQAPKPRKAVS